MPSGECKKRGRKGAQKKNPTTKLAQSAARDFWKQITVPGTMRAKGKQDPKKKIWQNLVSPVRKKQAKPDHEK